MTTKRNRPTGRGGISRRDILAAAGSGALLASSPGLIAQQQEKGFPVWLGMDQRELDAAYDQRVYAPNMDQIAEQEALRNLAAIARLGVPLQFAYGTAANETLDIYQPEEDGAPIQIFIHGGTWRFGAASEAAYKAEPFVHGGAIMVIPDFSPVEDVAGGLGVLVQQIRNAVAWTYNNAHRFGGDRERIYLSGHSSGGHLAAMALTTNWQRDFDLPGDLLKGGLCSSGMYDLEPVRLSWRNSYLQLTDETVNALSPQRHIDRLSSPLILAYGTYETPEFQRQSRDFAAAVRAAGKSVELLVGTGYNHFELGNTLAGAYELLGHAALKQMGLVPE